MKDVYLGASLVIGCLAAIALILSRFEWLQQFSLVRYVSRWGMHRPWSFPASRFGVISGFLIFLVIGAMMMDSQSRLVPKEAWISALILVGVYVAGAAIHDFILHKRGKSFDHPTVDQIISRYRSKAFVELSDSVISAISKKDRDIEILFTPASVRKITAGRFRRRRTLAGKRAAHFQKCVHLRNATGSAFRAIDGRTQDFGGALHRRYSRAHRGRRHHHARSRSGRAAASQDQSGFHPADSARRAQSFQKTFLRGISAKAPVPGRP
jgi:hypothetical protein